MKIEAVGYKKHDGQTGAVLQIKVTNLGLSDQIHSDIRIRLENMLIKVKPAGTAGSSNPSKQKAGILKANIILGKLKAQLNQKSKSLGSPGAGPDDNFFFINGLEKRSYMTFDIPVELHDPAGQVDFY